MNKLLSLTDQVNLIKLTGGHQFTGENRTEKVSSPSLLKPPEPPVSKPAPVSISAPKVGQPSGASLPTERSL